MEALGIAFYTVLVGAGASVVRAAVMGWFGLLAVQIGRRQNGLSALQTVEGYTLLRTDRNGWIELCTDGKKMWVEAAQ